MDEDAQILNGLEKNNVPEDLKEIVNRIAQDAEDVDLRLAEFKFIHSLRMVGVAVGGAVMILGILFILVSIFVFFNLFDLTISDKLKIVISATSLVVGATQMLAGTILIGR